MSCHQMVQFNIKKEEDKRRMLECLHRLLRVIELHGDSVFYPRSFERDICEEVLVSKIKIWGELPDRKYLARSLMRNAVIALKKQGLENPDWKDFDRELKNLAKAYVNKPLVDYCIFFPFHVSESCIDPKQSWVAHKRWINVLGMRFRRVSWRKVQDLPGWEQFLRGTQDHFLFQYNQDSPIEYLAASFRGFTPLLVDVRARTSQEAFDLASRNFELLRALVNLASGYGLVYEQWGVQEPLGVSLPPPIYGVFWADGNHELHYTIERYDYKAKEFERDKGLWLEKALGRIATASEEMQPLMIEVLLKYGQAMDTADWRSAFLALWQILEDVSLRTSDNNLSMEKVVKRISVLIGLKPKSLEKDLIDSLAQSRHLLVHQGKFSEEGLEEVNFLKIVAEWAINALFARAEKFPTPQLLEEFYNHATLGDSILHTRRKAIDTILSSRQ